MIELSGTVLTLKRQSREVHQHMAPQNGAGQKHPTLGQTLGLQEGGEMRNTAEVHHSTQEGTHDSQTAFLSGDRMKIKGQVQHSMQ